MTLALQDAVIAGVWSFVSALIVGLSFRLSKQFFPSQRTSSHVLVTAVLSISIGVFYLSVRWHQGFAGHFDRYDGTTAHSAMNDEANRLVVLSNRVYPFFGSRRQNVVLQPMLFYGIDAVAESCDAFDADMVATRVDNHKILARYRPSWDELAKDPRFESIESGSGRLKLFHYTPVLMDDGGAARR